MNSVGTIASLTTSYILKSLVSIFCGIYSLNLNFLKEVNEENTFYEKCLPELLHHTFQTKNNQSKFRSAFFTAARSDFDHQREVIQKFKFHSQYDGFDIIDHSRYVPDLGMFGPANPNISPLLWK
ncbi:unnamed protein product [Adineta steineri]|uniref:Uncharacterized protein n=1 Tax=Adineta steineri TaxID=433720 RepID=A0A819JL66_9BILA|nr:unnamed protein product [Adineta steineri]CAF3932339.1 unnamed protein product [Adineta steineri]